MWNACGSARPGEHTWGSASLRTRHRLFATGIPPLANARTQQHASLCNWQSGMHRIWMGVNVFVAFSRSAPISTAPGCAQIYPPAF